MTLEKLETFAYSKDARLFGATDAAVVVRPVSTNEVSKIMRYTNHHIVPIVVRGSGSSIYGQPKGTEIAPEQNTFPVQ